MNHKLMVLGIILLVISIWQSVVLKEPHFFSLFSIGLFFILYAIYHKIYGKNLFSGWKKQKVVLFFFVVLAASIIMDIIGMHLGYWIYPHYDSLFDNILKYLFEWALPLVDYMIIFIIGVKIYLKSYKPFTSVILALFTFLLISAIFTEYINSFSYSWQIIKMPLLDYNLGVFNLCFVAIGYWLMALISYFIYSRFGGKI